MQLTEYEPAIEKDGDDHVGADNEVVEISSTLFVTA